MVGRRALAGVLCLAMAAGGCQGTGTKKEAGDATQTAAPEAAAEKPGLPALVIHDAVPASASAVVVLRGSTPWLDFWKRAPVGSVRDEDLAALKKELDEYLGQKWGLAVTGVHGFTGVVGSGKDDACVLVHGVSGGPKGDKVGEVAGHAIYGLDGGDVYAAVLGDTLAIGPRTYLEVVLKAAAGTEPRLAGSNEPLASLLTQDTENASVVLAAVLDRLPEELRKDVAGHGVERARVIIGASGIFAVGEGDPARLEALAAQLRAALNLAKTAAEAQKERAKAGDDVAEGIAGILGYHGALQLERAIEPKVEGGKLTVGLPLAVQDPTVVVAIMGILSAIAIPAFTKYMRRAKTSEARLGLDQLYNGMAFYHAQHGRCPAKGEGSAGVTPPLELDCNGGPGGRCVPSEVAAEPGYYPMAAWTDNPVWAALGFRQEQAHYFHYDLRWNEVPQGCEFTVQAFGDLDDDGIFSTYERSGIVDDDGIRTLAGLYTNDELE